MTPMLAFSIAALLSAALSGPVFADEHGDDRGDDAGDDRGDDRTKSAFRVCSNDLQDTLEDNLPDNFVAYIIDADDTQGKPIQCVDQALTASDCDYLSSKRNACDMSGLFAPQSIDIFDGSVVSCNTAGGLLRCNSVTQGSGQTSRAEDDLNRAFRACPSELQEAMDENVDLNDNFVAYIIDADDTQGKPIQCFDQARTASDCDYLSGDNSCGTSGLFAPQSIDIYANIYDGSVVSCNTAGGIVRCNSVRLKTDEGYVTRD